MAELTTIVESIGFTEVTTLLQSGNVIFESPKQSETSLIKKLEQGLIDKLGYEVKVILRSHNEILQMIERDPFAGITSTKDTKCYVTLLPKQPENIPDLPFISEKESFEITVITEREIYTIAHRQPSGAFGTLAYIEKTFGKHSTTRNWNTIMKLQ